MGFTDGNMEWLWSLTGSISRPSCVMCCKEEWLKHSHFSVHIQHSETEDEMSYAGWTYELYSEVKNELISLNWLCDLKIFCIKTINLR